MRKLMSLIAVTAGLQLAVQPAAAQAVCAAKVTKATGGASVLEGAARSKARTAWIRKVTASRKLGPGYAAWLRAKDQTYTCSKIGKRHVCEARAVPCRT